ncbi:MAG: mechanosensitive ion channel family protein, partial [Thermoplasmata archaeon]|nr:mechanosensitive ion channel family protein [Thermoplasmata archaeon]
RILHRIVKKTKTTVDDELFAIVRGPVIGLILLYGLVLSFGQLDINESAEGLAAWLYKIVLAVALMWVGWSIYKKVILPLIAHGTMKKSKGLERSLIPVMESIGKIAMLFIGVMVFLGFLGVDPTVLVASFGLVGLVVAFAAQDTLANLFAGIHLLLDRPFRLDDIIVLEDGDYYEVKSVGMRSTRLFNTFRNTMVIFPNSVVAGGKIVNLSEPDPQYKLRIHIDVAYDSDIEKAKKIMLDVTMGVEHVLHEEGQTPLSKISDFKDSGIDMLLMFWVDHFDNQWGAAATVRQRMLEEFGKQGIEIPFPQVVIHKAEN